jgi:hypothetical protein
MEEPVSYSEPRVKFPDPRKSVITTRDLTLSLPKGMDKSAQQPVGLQDVKLIVLVNRCLYLVAEEVPGRLVVGEVLSRNLRLTELYGGTRGDVASEVFVKYNNLNRALRSVEHVLSGLETFELPVLESWKRVLMALMRSSWSLAGATAVQIAEHVSIAEETIATHGRVRNDEKVFALAETIRSVVLEDSRGQHNPARIPLIARSGERHVDARIAQALSISYRMVWRRIVLKDYVRQMREIVTHVADVSHQLLVCWLFTGHNRTTRRVRVEAGRMSAEAAWLRTFVGRPFSNTFGHCADDLESASRLLIQSADLVRAGDPEAGANLVEVEVLGLIQKTYRASESERRHHWPLENMMVETSLIAHGRLEVTGAQVRKWRNLLSSIHHSLVVGEKKLTQQRWDEGFDRPTRPLMMANVHLARTQLLCKEEDGGPNVLEMHNHLKKTSLAS